MRRRLLQPSSHYIRVGLSRARGDPLQWGAEKVRFIQSKSSNAFYIVVYPFIPKKSFSNTSSSFCESVSFLIDFILTVSESKELDFFGGLSGFDSASFFLFFGDSVTKLFLCFLGEVDRLVFLGETVVFCF